MVLTKKSLFYIITELLKKDYVETGRLMQKKKLFSNKLTKRARDLPYFSFD